MSVVISCNYQKQTENQKIPTYRVKPQLNNPQKDDFREMVTRAKIYLAQQKEQERTH